MSRYTMRPTRRGLLSNSFDALLFVGCSAVAWLVVNHFVVYSEEGFDPLRYEYFARSQLPEYWADSSSYTIVFLLKFIYFYLPFYAGFVLFMWLCVSMVLYSINIAEVRYAVISPITFFYVAQTGKDGLSILAIACVAIIATRKIAVSHINLAVLVAIAILVRPALIIFILIAFVFIRFGFRKAVVCALVLATGFLITGIGNQSLFMLEGIVSDEGSGSLAKLGRELTLGYSLTAVLGRSILLLVSPFIQPAVSVIKFLNGSDLFVLFEGACQFFFMIALFRYRIVSTFIVSSIPFVILVSAVSPFYHFRYMAILYPLIFFISIIVRRKKKTKRRAEFVLVV